MKKFTKAQLQAIEGMKWNLDELDNKPRRLYEAIRNFLEAFTEKKDESYYEKLDSIDIAESKYYLFLNIPSIAGDIINNITSVTKELIGNAKIAQMKLNKCHEEYIEGYKRGIKEGTELLTTKTTETLIKFPYK